MAKSESVKKPLSAVQLRVLRNMIEQELGPLVKKVNQAKSEVLRARQNAANAAREARRHEINAAILAEARRRPNKYIVLSEYGSVSLDLGAVNKAIEKKYPVIAAPSSESEYEEIGFAALRTNGEYDGGWRVHKTIAPAIRQLANQINVAVLNGAADGLIEAIQGAATSLREAIQQ